MTDPLMSQRANEGIGGFLSAGLTWPRRGRPNSLNFRPLRSTNPGQSPEASMDSPQPAFLSSQSQQKSGYVSPLKAASRTMKEYDQEIDSLRSENFKLKLSLYFLESDMEKRTNSREERDILKMNLQLKVDTEIIKRELAQKNTALHEIMIAMERQEEQHKLELQRAREIQVDLENQVEALKQELEKERMQTPRSSDVGSEIYKQAFGMDESLSGMSSDHEASVEQIRSQYVSELDKMHCTIDEKDKEIKNMKIVIDDLEKNNNKLEEKVRKRNLAIQGFLQMAKKQDSIDNLSQSQGCLQQHLAEAIEAANAGNQDSVISNMDLIRKELKTILSASGSEVSLDLSDNTEHLKREIARKDDIIKNLPSCSNYSVERECDRLEKAVREKDNLIQELLEEQTKMSTEHGKTVKNLVTQLKNLSGGHSRIVDLSVFDPESVKLLQEQICEKDAEINKHKKTADILKSELTKCQTELQNSLVENENKTKKILQLTNRGLELENELAEIRHNMHMLKREHEQCKMLSAKDPGSDQGRRSSGIQEILINLEDSLQSPVILSESDNPSLIKVREPWQSQEGNIPLGTESSNNLEVHDQHSSFQGTRLVDNLTLNLPDISDPSLQPTSSNTKEISEYVSLKTSTNETVRLCINMQIKDRKKPKESVDCVEHSAEQSEQEKVLQILEDKNEEIVKLERTLTVQQDLANVLAEDKKCLQEELRIKVSDVQFLTVACRDFERQVHSLQSQHCTDVKRVEELEQTLRHMMDRPRIPVLKSCAAVQTDKIPTKDSECNTVFFSLESGATSFGQSDCVNILQADVCMLILMVEEKDKEIQQYKELNDKLTSELENMMAQNIQSNDRSQRFSSYSEDSSVALQQLNTSQDLNSMLLQHLKQVARFMESLLPSRGTKILDASSLTPESVSNVMKHICDSIELSQNLSHSLSFWEESRIFNLGESSRVTNESSVFAQSESSKLNRNTLGPDEGFGSTSGRIQSEGSELLSVPHQKNASGSGKSWTQPSLLQRKPAMETGVENYDSDQLTILGVSSSDQCAAYLNKKGAPDPVFSNGAETVLKSKKSEYIRPAAFEARKNLNHTFEDAVQFVTNVHHQHLCWYGPENGKNVLHSCICCPNRMDAVVPVESYQRCNGIPYCNISSDSDIWSEPDRNLSLQRIGIDLEAPSFHSRSPPKRRRSSRDRQLSEDFSSESTISLNGISKGKPHPRRKKSIGSFRRDVTEPKLDILVENRLLTLERSIEDKLALVQKLTQTVQVDIAGLTEMADKSSNETHSLMNISVEISNLQSTLANAVDEVKILKDTTKESSQVSHECDLSEQLKLYNEEILSKIDDIEQMKEILIKERYARESAEQNLYLCHQELLTVKHQLSVAMLKLEEKCKLEQERKFVLRASAEELSQESHHIPEEPIDTDSSRDVDHLRKNLAKEEEMNKFLTKQVNDVLNENRKLKVESEQLQLHLMEEQRNLEEVRQQFIFEQDVVKQLSKGKHASESKTADLAASLVRMRSSLTDLQDQNRNLSKRISTLLSENNKMKVELEVSQTQLNSEREQNEKLSKEHVLKQQSLSQLAKEKLVAENEIAHLVAEIESLKRKLAEQDHQNSSLNKQVTDLSNDNWKVRKELEQLEVRLRNEAEHVEAAHKAKSDLHKTNMDLITEKGDLENRLHCLEDKVSVLTEEKTDLSKQMFEGQRENKNLVDQMKTLADQKALLEKEISKYKTEIHSSDSICDEARYDLKQAKEKLKRLELKYRQYENEMTQLTTSNEHLMSEKSNLERELESQTSKVLELSKQHGETKRLLKEKTKSCIEIEREKSHLVDLTENLKSKKVQAEMSRDKLLADYDSLVAKVNNLELNLKDSDLSLQKNKDEQERLKQQTNSLLNKIKQKESLIKDLEEQQEILHEQLKDLQHNLNKSDIDLKHVEDENHSLELRLLSLQKQLNKTSSHLEMKDDEIMSLQEQIFKLEQKVKDKEMTQKRALAEKQISEEKVQELQHHIKKKESVHKLITQQEQELREQIAHLAEELQNKEFEGKRSKEKMTSLQADIEEKEKALSKLESSMKKLEHKLSITEETNAQLTHRLNQTEIARKLSEEQTEAFRKELNELKESMKPQREERGSASHLSIAVGQLNDKEEYCKALENKVIEYRKKLENLQQEYNRLATAPTSQFSEIHARSVERMHPIILPNKVFSEPRSSQEYRLHRESKLKDEQDNFVKCLELDNNDLKMQIEILKKKFDIAEKVKSELEEENHSLWKTLYGSEHDKNHIIQTLESRNSELKKQVEVFENKIELFEKSQLELEEEKNTLWKTLYGKEGKEADMAKRFEQKNKELKDQLDAFQVELRSTEESKEILREERDALWKTIHGKKDEKTDVIRLLQLKNNDLKGQMGDLQKKLDASEKAKCEFEEEKNSLWKALYGQHGEKSDVTKMLEMKNKELMVTIEVLEKKLDHCEKAKADIEEKKDTLWKTLHGSQDEKTEAMKKMEERNNGLKAQIATLQKKLGDADEMTVQLEEEKNSMWKTLCGSEDEKTDLLQQMEVRNVDLRGQIEILKRGITSLEKANHEIEEEKNSLWKTLYGSEHEQADIIRRLEVKNNDLKGQVHVLEKNLESSEKTKQDLEERINSLRVTLHGDENEKANAFRSMELKNSDLLAQIELLNIKLSDMEKDKNEIEEEKASLWKTLCGNEDEKTDVMKLVEQKNNDLKVQVEDLENQLKAAEKARKEVEDEKNSLWKTLYGSEHEQSDIIKRLERKNNDLNEQVASLERKLNISEEAKNHLEEEKASLWKALHGSDDEKTHEIKSLEMKNSGLKGQLEVLQRKLSATEKLKNDFEEEKNSLWKNMYGSQDEKAAALTKLNLEISDLKSVVQNLESKLSVSENTNSGLKEENVILSEKLHESAEENANMSHKLELKDHDMKSQIEVLEEKLKVSEDLKKSIEEERNSLYNQLLGDPSGAKLEGMLKETQIYADQVKKLEHEIGNKSSLLLEVKEKLFKSENSLTTQEKVVGCLKKQISDYKMQLQRALAEKEWFQNQYIDSQRQVIRAAHSATAESEIRPEDVVIVQKENVDLKKEVTDLLSVIQGKDTTLTLPPVHTELLTIKVPEFVEQKPGGSLEHRLSSEMQRAELERLQVEKHYLQKVLNDLKKQMESQAPQLSGTEHQPEKIAVQKESSGFSLSIAEQLAHNELPNEEVKEEMKQLRNERDYFRNLVNNLQNEMQLYTSSLRDKGPSTYAEAENGKLRKENADLKSKLVEMHARVKKRESMIKALSSKIVELSDALKDSRVSSGKELTEPENAPDHMSLLASQIVEHSSKVAEKSLSEVIMIPEVSTFDFKDEEDRQLLSLLHPTLQHPVPGESGVQDMDAESMQTLKYQVKELEHQLADTLMDNYRLQDEINTVMLKFGIQNNKVVCEKCGKSAEISSAQPSTDIKAISKKFTSYFKHLDRDPVFSKEDRINKLSENKWKLQNEVLNMQRTLCLSNPAYFEQQESFNNHIAKMVATEYPKIPVRIFSEPFLVSKESKDVVQKTRHLELLWKNQVLHLERDVKCLQNYRTFLEHFVLGLVKELTVPTKQKAEVSATTSSMEERSQIQGTRVPAIFLKPPQLMQDAAVTSASESTIKPSSTFMIPPENGSLPQKVVTTQEAQLFSGLPAGKTVPTEVREDSSSSQYMTVSGLARQISSVPYSVGTSAESLTDIPNLQNRIRELNKAIENLKSENMNLQTENKKLSLQIEKMSKIKNWNEKQFEKQVEVLKESLKNMKSLNATLDLELDFHRRLLQTDKSSEKQPGYIKKSDVMKYLHEMNAMNCKMERLTEENIMLRKKLMKLPSPASKAAKYRETSGDEESSSEKGSEETRARSSLSSSESFESYPGKYGSASKQYQDPSEFHGISTTQRKGRHEPSQESVHRPHFSSPDLGIESDPNYEQRLLESTQEEKICMKPHPSKRPVTPSRARQGRPATETVAAMWESVQAGVAVGESLLAMGDLKDYTLLRKEIDESVVLVKSMYTTAKHCVEHLGNSSSANKNLACSTVREILNKLIPVKVCQDKAQQIVSSFWVSTVPASEEFYVEQMTLLLNENQELRRKLEIILERREHQKAELKEAFGRLKVAEASKEKMERAIAKQLSRTNKVLKHVRTNTKGPEAQDPASHRSSNPSSKKKSSTK